MDIEKLKKFEKLPPDVKRQLALYMAKWKDKKKQADIKEDFMAFVKHVWPDFIEGRHHQQVAKKFNDIATGKTDSILKIDSEKISRPFILDKNLFVIKDNAIIKLN